ncbi:MICOS complex subunit MIC13 homolog QIL1 isoform X2 [Calliopsis andreniformis]|uniref:MICOS complex subunit MIC13 homolog QIL1 isoform X2 n=1 Tax=Calliopsis andreniformis TaxID=337506 RepID=UPI003FCC472E
MGWIWFTIKSSIVGGVVYYTYCEGVWSKSEETAKLYQKVYATTAPYIRHNIPKDIRDELSALPSVNDLSSFVKTSWNKGVMTSMEFLADLPTHVTNGASSLSEVIQKYMKDIN